MCCSPATIPARASAGTATATCSSRSSASRSARRPTLRFRQRTGERFSRANLEVAPRSAYLLSGEARHDWEHSITPGEQLRFSITFRTLSDKGRRIAAQQPRNGSPPERFSRACGAVLLLLLARRLLEGARGRPAIYQQARSLAAEWALVNEQAAQGKLTATYVADHAQVAARAAADRVDLADRSRTAAYGAEIAALLQQPDDAPPDELRAHADKLKQIEDSLESA